MSNWNEPHGGPGAWNESPWGHGAWNGGAWGFGAPAAGRPGAGGMPQTGPDDSLPGFALAAGGLGLLSIPVLFFGMFASITAGITGLIQLLVSMRRRRTPVKRPIAVAATLACALSLAGGIANAFFSYGAMMDFLLPEERPDREISVVIEAEADVPYQLDYSLSNGMLDEYKFETKETHSDQTAPFRAEITMEVSAKDGSRIDVDVQPEGDEDRPNLACRITVNGTPVDRAESNEWSANCSATDLASFLP